jgi:hypothetical protein
MMAVSIKRSSDREIESLMELWRNEPVLWDVGSANYMNSDHHRAAMQRVSAQTDGVGVGIK